MGPNPSKGEAVDEGQILKKAAQFVQQLKLFKTDGEYKQQRHLFARILIYGHSNLITHLKKFQKAKQQQIIRQQLKFLDYETTDLLFQNLVLKKIKDDKKKSEYEEYKYFVHKSQERQRSPSKYRECAQRGEELYKANKVAIILFSGSTNFEFKDRNNELAVKQTFKQRENQKCLLQIALDKLLAHLIQKPDTIIYLVHSQSSHSKIKQVLKKYTALSKSIKIVLQNQNPIVNLSGKMCIKKKESLEVLTAPLGFGDLPNLSVKGTKLFEDLVQNNIQYVSVLGVDNILADIVDPYMVGLLDQSSASFIFKTTYPNNENENLKRVIFNKQKKLSEVDYFEQLLEKSQKNSYSLLRKSPVWMESVVFKFREVKQYFNKQKARLNRVFTLKKFQCTFWNPATEVYNQMQHCYAFERQLSGLLFNQQLKSMGLMVQREDEFLPVLTLDGEWSWQEAYNQYQYKTGRSDKNKAERFFANGFIQNSEI